MRYFRIIIIFISIVAFSAGQAHAFWLWTPQDKKAVNPKYAVKDSPREQFEWALRFYEQGDFKRAAEEFVRLVKSYPDSDIAPESQYYAGRSYEELGKYWFAYENYQKTAENYPYTHRMEEIIEREYNIAQVMQKSESPRIMELELSLSLDRASIIYGKIVDNSSFGPYAVRSLYAQADCFRRMRHYNKAIEAYERIVNDYPDSNLVPEAKYQMAYTRYEASLDPEYDQESTDEALQEFQELSKNTAVPAIREQAIKVLDELKIKKAESIMKIGNFYERQGKRTSALIYYQDVINRFDGTPAAEEAKVKVENIKKRIKK